jgi:putative DNA primase/helicase
VLKIPFEVSIPIDEQDRDLKRKLRGKRDGVFMWMLAGWARYLAAGKLVVPPSVSRAVEDYGNREDLVPEFASEALADGTAQIPVSTVHDVFRFWICRKYGARAFVPSQRYLTSGLKRLKY